MGVGDVPLVEIDKREQHRERETEREKESEYAL